MTYYRKNKFNAKKTSFGGNIYDSKLEATYAEKLEWRKKAGEVIEIKPQYRLDLVVKNKTWRTYKIDFRVECSDGTIEYIEVKGFPTSDWKMKWDMTILLFDEITQGEKAKLILNDKVVKESYF